MVCVVPATLIAIAVFALSPAVAMEPSCFDSRSDPLSLNYEAFRAAVVDYQPRDARPNVCEKTVLNWMALYRSRNLDKLEPDQHFALLEIEGRRRAVLGEYENAIVLFDGARSLARGWPSREFSDATVAFFDAQIAFLKGDIVALISARDRMRAVPPPADWQQRQTLSQLARVPQTWPPADRYVSALVECFGKPFEAVLQSPCLGHYKAGARIPYYK